ncbi:hypothetical protein QJQ45_013003 [Haematococcus lacustris]|nr:hypothetical protein QJQ45_013003 [Haematococcus lacustris]
MAVRTPPHKWWDVVSTRDNAALNSFAQRITSQSASTTSCERAWSSTDFIQNKRRNRLKSDTADKLIRLYFNSRLLERAAKGAASKAWEWEGEEGEEGEGEVEGEEEEPGMFARLLAVNEPALNEMMARDAMRLQVEQAAQDGGYWATSVASVGRGEARMSNTRMNLNPMQVRRRRELQAAMQAATPSRQRHLRSQLQRLQRLQHPPHRAAWMSLTPLILLTASPHLHPAFHLLALARAKPGVSGNLPEAGLPSLLRRIVSALRGLGCPADLSPELPLPVGPACGHIPVWGNPLLAMEDAQQPLAPFPQQAGAQALQWVAEWATTSFQELAAIPSLTNLSSLLHLCRVTQPAGRGSRVGSREWLRAVWGEEQVARSIAVAVRANPARCATGLFAMWARLPTGWQQEVARQDPLPAPADPQALQRVAVAMVMDRLGWLPKGPPPGRAPAPPPIPILEGATVKCLTRVLMEPVTMLRAEANARFVKDALAGMTLLLCTPSPTSGLPGTPFLTTTLSSAPMVTAKPGSYAPTFPRLPP